MQADGKILVGGDFNGVNSIGGQARNRIARLDATTGLADSFNPNANNVVYAIAVQADGRILAGGDFSGANSIGGQTRNFIARLDATTGLADSFDPNANSSVYAIAVQADGRILAGGIFNGANSIGGQTRNHIARLDPSTGLADSFDPNANVDVNAIAVQADGRILAGGDFNGANSIGGQTRNRIARLDATTGLADSFDPNASNIVYSIAVQADGKILAGGFFNGANSIGGQTRNFIARLETDGRVDEALRLNIVGSDIFATAVQPDGKILIGGDFSSVLGVTRNNIARVNPDGTLDTAFDPSASGTVYAIAVQADGKILAGGNFNGASSIGGQTRNYIARLDATTGLPDLFDPNANGPVYAIAVQADGKILAGGSFSGANSIGGQMRNRIARLNPTTGSADPFDPNATNNIVWTIAVQADGKILAGGSFFGPNSIGGQTRNNIARLNATTGSADSFDPDANSTVYAIAVQPDGKILTGGDFTGIGGATRNSIARLDAAGVADSFNPNANDGLRSIAVQADGKILAGGFFTSIGGTTRNRIARLDATTGLADSFDPNASDGVLSIALEADGKILAGGIFSGANSIGGQTRNRFARLTNDTAALQNLAVTQTSITWTRGGSSPQLARVTFEKSTDGANYTPLGNGTAAGGNWTLTGLSLPTGQNFYIRARGYYRSGILNGSESITESVRNAFIVPPTPTQVVSRKTHGGAGDFSVNLPLTGTPGIECRTGGATGDYEVVITFANAVTVNGNPQADVTTGIGDVGTGGVANGGVVSINGAVVTVPLTNVANAQTIVLRLFNVSDGVVTGNVSVPMGVLVGDTNGDKFVNSGDSLQTRNRSGQGTDTTAIARCECRWFRQQRRFLHRAFAIRHVQLP